MKPGRDLDILIATHVMGWKRLTYAQANPESPGYANRTDLTGYWHDSTGAETRRAEDCPDYYAPEDAWSPSTDISAAQEVVFHMLEGSGQADYFELWYEKGFWQASFAAGSSLTNSTEEPAEAICLAALAAVGVKI